MRAVFCLFVGQYSSMITKISKTNGGKGFPCKMTLEKSIPHTNYLIAHKEEAEG